MDKIKSKTLYGKLYVYFETGYEGSIWAFEEEGKSGYDGLHILKNGDLLKVFNSSAKKKLIFSSKIDFKEERKPPFYLKSNMQKNISKKTWQKMFVSEKPAQLKLK